MTAESTAELSALRSDLVTMAQAVNTRVADAFDALLDRNPAAAGRVRKGDRAIDLMEMQITEECLRVLALFNPVAGDLRFVVAALDVCKDLERIADLAKGIGKRVIDMCDLPAVSTPEELRLMADGARSMYEKAVIALTTLDEDLAGQVRRSDRTVDQAYRGVYLWSVNALSEHEEHARAVLDLLTAARAIERIADLSTNVAEEVVFAAAGRSVRHSRPD